MQTSKACNIQSKYTAFIPVDLDTNEYLPTCVEYINPRELSGSKVKNFLFSTECSDTMKSYKEQTSTEPPAVLPVVAVRLPGNQNLLPSAPNQHSNENQLKFSFSDNGVKRSSHSSSRSGSRKNRGYSIGLGRSQSGGMSEEAEDLLPSKTAHFR